MKFAGDKFDSVLFDTRRPVTEAIVTSGALLSIGWRTA